MGLIKKEKANKNKELRRRKPAQPRSHQLVADILEATAQVLEEQGYELLSTNKVAERAGVSIGSIYQYFSNKSEMVEAMVQEQCDQLSRTVLAQLMSIMEKPFPEAAETCISLYVEYLAMRPSMSELLLQRIIDQNAAQHSPLLLMNIDEERAMQLINTYLLRHQSTLGFTDLKSASYMAYHVSLLLGVRIALLSVEERQKQVKEVVRMLSLYVGALPHHH